MDFWKKNKVLSVLILAAVLAAGIVFVQRMSTESKSDKVEFVIDYKEVCLLAEQSEHDVSWWLKEFKKLGVSGAGLAEASLDTLMEENNPVKATLANDLKEEIDWQENCPPALAAKLEGKDCDEFDVVVETGSKEMTDFVNRAFTERFDKKRTSVFPDGEDRCFFLIDGTAADGLYEETSKYIDSAGKGFVQKSDLIASKIMYLNLGLEPEKMDIIREAGMTVVPRTIEYEGWNDTNFAKDVTGQYEKYDCVPRCWILAGRVVPGYDDDENIDYIADYIRNNGITIGIVEDTTQRQNLDPDGLEELIEKTDYNTIRVFSVWNYIQNRFKFYGYEGSEEVDNSLFRAAVERNISLIYYKPMKLKNDAHRYVTNPKEYEKSFANIERRLARHGITIGEVAPEPVYRVPLLLQILIAIGVGSGILILLGMVFDIPSKWIWILLGLGAVGAAGAFFAAPNLAGLLTSFAASVTLPCLAAAWLMNEGAGFRRRREGDGASVKYSAAAKKGLLLLLTCAGISFCGAMMTAAPISGTNYMLELSIFRGVKIAQLLPLGFFCLLFLMFFGYLWGKKSSEKLETEDLKQVLFYSLPIWLVLLSGALAAAGYFYLARTGHETNVSASTAELLVRNFLEEILYARPRTKEFLAAFPAVFLFVYCLMKDMKIFSFVFGLTSVIGFTSIVNTFMHIRTPLVISIVRTGYSLVFGIVLGLIYLAIFDFLVRLYHRRGNRKHA